MGPRREPASGVRNLDVIMVKPSVSLSVPKTMTDRFEAITALTDALCDAHLDVHYRTLARRMTAALCCKRPSPLSSGHARTWAGSILYHLGQINFLSDPDMKPFMTTAQLAERSGTGQSTLQAKSRVIGDALRANRLSLEWLVPSMIENNPMVWMAKVNGFIVDLRHMPRDVQEIALANGLIPYLPTASDRSETE